MARVFISHSSRDNEPAARIKAWLSEQGFETPFLDYDKHAGIPPGADWEKTLYREIERSEAIVIIQTPNWLDSKWCFAEFTQARALGKSIFPIIETPTGDTLISPDIQALDLRKDREGGLEQLSSQLTQIALDAQGGFAWDASRPPYPGLLAFQEEDAAIYFGRDDDIRRLIERLNARRAQGGTKLIALLGASGSGKSSLLRAGVIPRLKRAGRNWVVLPPMRPQARPVGELARSLAVACGEDADWRKLREELNGDNLPLALSDIANDLRMKAAANEAQILLPIDQGEELFGTADAHQAKRFFEVLNVALSSDQPFIAVMALRSDYLGLLQSAERLTARFEEFSLAPMPLARIAQIIEGPARVAGLGIDEAFVHQAARDAETEDALPLLAFALRELYDRATDDNYLSLDKYNALGDEAEGLTPLENAVRKAADDVLAEARPGDEELTALREAFVPAMVRVNEEGEYVRRPARWDELPGKSHPLLEQLAKARLLVVSQDGDARMVEVAHEALLRKWPRLRAWLDDAREFLAGKQQLERDLHDWERAPEADKTGALLAGLKLNRARGWLSERPHQLTAQERTLVLASIDHAEDAERRKVRSRRIITGVSIAAALVLACVAGWAFWQERIAKRNLVSASLERAQSAHNEGLLGESLFWLWRAYDVAPTGDRRRESALRLIGERAHRLGAPIYPGEKVKSATFSPDGTGVLIINGDNTAHIWDVESGDRIKDKDFKAPGKVDYAVFSPDGTRVLTAAQDYTPTNMWSARIWDVDRGDRIKDSKDLSGSGYFRFAVFSPHGNRVLTFAGDEPARIWDVETGTPVPVPFGSIRSAVFSPDGNSVLTFAGDEPVRIWDIEERTSVPVPFGSVRSAVFSSDGNRILTIVGDSIARIWSVDSGEWIKDSKDFRVPGLISSAALGPDGARVLTVSGRNTIRIWSAEEESEIAVLKIRGDAPYTEGRLPVLSPDGRRVLIARGLTGSYDRDWILQVWHVDRDVPATLGADGTSVAAADPSKWRPYGLSLSTSNAEPDGTLVSTAYGDLLLKEVTQVNMAILSPNGEYIVTVGGFPPAWRNFPPRIWDAKTGNELYVLAGESGHTGITVRADFSPDGTRIVTTSEDRSVRLWETDSGKVVAIFEIQGNTTWPKNAGFSPDGTLVICTFENGKAVFDAESGRLVLPAQHSLSPLHPPALNHPAWLRLSVEIRSGLAWDEKTKLPYDLSGKELSKKREQLPEEEKHTRRFFDAREWKDLTKDELKALRGPGRK